MSKKTGIMVFSMLVAVLLLSMVMVPVGGRMPRCSNPGIVDDATLQGRTNPLLYELLSKGCSDEEIAEAIVSYPRVAYPGDWTEEGDKRISPLLQQGRGANYTIAWCRENRNCRQPCFR